MPSRGRKNFLAADGAVKIDKIQIFCISGRVDREKLALLFEHRKII